MAARRHRRHAGLARRDTLPGVPLGNAFHLPHPSRLPGHGDYLTPFPPGRPLSPGTLFAVIIAVLVTVPLAACAGAGGRSQSPGAQPSGTPSTRRTAQSPAGASPTPGPALPRLSPTQLAGQRIIYSYPGPTPPAALLRWIRAGEVGGVIFFGPNITSRTQFAAVVAELRRASESSRNPLRALPLLLMTDQEGGLVRRLPGPPLRSELQIGQSAHPVAAARQAGTAAGRNLAHAGLNVNLAPVLDVYRTPGDFDGQFGRSYSTDPAEVARLGAAFIKAQQATGVAATSKHFPGLGAASSQQNTDEKPVTLQVPGHQLRAVDEYPYRAAIAAGVKLVMVSWAVYPALDPGTPAGLSATIVGGELRQRLHFGGVTITDALEAGALAPFGSIGHRATLAARAGMDLILCSGQQAGEGRQARLALVNGYRSGSLGHAAFASALRRIIALRESLAR